MFARSVIFIQTLLLLATVYYDHQTARFIDRDPIGFAGGDINLYAYAWNNPVNWNDPRGLFEEGVPYALYRGHNDFVGHDRFDYYLEDRDWSTSPLVDPERHFRDLTVSEHDVAAAIMSCDKSFFERAMHRLQDYYFHYAKGFRWEPSRLQFGHLGYDADNDPVAWAKANRITEKCIMEWDAHCKCK